MLQTTKDPLSGMLDASRARWACSVRVAELHHAEYGLPSTFLTGMGFAPCSSAFFGVPGCEDTLASSFEEAIGSRLSRG